MNLFRLISVCASLAWVLILSIRDTSAADTFGPFQIVEQRVIRKEGRDITFNRVVPPLLPTASVSDTKATDVSVAQELKDHQMLSISATVYDRLVTELRWWKDGKSFHAWSNIDFNFIAGMGAFETPEAIYSLVLGLGNETSQTPSEAKTRPTLEEFPSGQSSYILIKQDSPSVYTAQDVAAMDALHRYYDANRAKLQQSYAKREQQRITHEQWQKEHPPVPQDTTINFWPIKSSVYLNKGESK